ncbi:MAG: hypothetical protein MJ147_08205 [Clostridia bacterium]|nr:hypothetical protein [Clostridia bacterium]
MRPIKDLIFEEYWNIGYRFYNDDDTVVDGSQKTFNQLKANSRYWYADPFLFELNGETFLFVEMFDNITEVGVLGVSKFENGIFTEPKPVITENFHLSYPYVFEKNGKIYMMPETHEDSCIQLYEAVNFPDEWKKSEVIVKDVNVVDTVIENGFYLASTICESNDMSVDLSIFDENGIETPFSPVYCGRFDKRGAGQTFTYKNMRIRPAQNCENGNYGGGLFFNKITQCDEKGYSEELFSTVEPQQIITDEKKQVQGIHTYARSSKIEIVDIKFKRFNLKRLFWILKKKAGI